MTFSTYGLTGYDVQYWDGSGWVTVTGGSITANNKVWRKINFTAINTSKIRVLTNAAIDNGYSRIAEVEAWSPNSSTSSASINWLVTDQLGTPRMIFDKTGSLANTKRHDYLPFGEELFAGTGGRTPTQGYTGDSVRQKFTLYERDNETNLDFAETRYYSSIMGRFTSPDEPFADQEEDDPQSWNLYTYVRNNPLRFIDSTGEGHIDPKTGIYVGDKDGECEDGLCWDEKNQAWVDNVPVNGGTVHETYDQTSSTPLIAGGVLVWEFAPPQVKVAAAGMGVLVGTALLAAYLDRDVINLAAPFTGPTTLPNSPRIDIVSPKPPPAPISKKKGEKRQVRAAARAAHMNYVQMRNAIHRWKADRGLPPNWKMSWEDLLAAAEEYRQLVEKRK